MFWVDSLHWCFLFDIAVLVDRWRENLIVFISYEAVLDIFLMILLVLILRDPLLFHILILRHSPTHNFTSQIWPLNILSVIWNFISHYHTDKGQMFTRQKVTLNN